MTARTLIAVFVLAGAAFGARASPPPAAPPARTFQSPALQLQDEQRRARLDLQRLEHEYLRWDEDRELFEDAARVAWAFVQRYYEPATGLVTAIPGYPYATAWDIGSMVAAFYSARHLGLLDDAGYVARVDRLLTTLGELPLYDGRIFNMAYHTRTGAMAGRSPGPAGEWGWSTTDLGRLLIWLKVVAADPRFAQKAEAAVRRNDFSAALKDGYLWGEALDPARRARWYQEGRIGYEQYAARGFALWGHRADRALDLGANALPVTIMGQRLAADVRRWDRLTSEPFVLWGLELGWDGPAASLAHRLLLAQEARYRRSGTLTIAGEDAVDVPPHFFYYYCVYANGRIFSLDVQDPRAVVDEPRWISAKSAFAFHVLLPSRYTASVLRSVSQSRNAAGWASGVYERDGRSTGLSNLNTAAVILTAALVDRWGGPVLAHAQQSSGE